MAARPCDANGNFLPPGSPPSPLSDKPLDDWTPYRSRLEFEVAEFLFVQNQMPAAQINKLLDLWATSLLGHTTSDQPPFADCKDLYKTIDSTPLGDVPWQSFAVKYTGERPEDLDDVPPWMDERYEVWYRDPREVVRNMLANPDYANEIDYRPFREFSSDGDERQYCDFMSGDWAWQQAVCITISALVHCHSY